MREINSTKQKILIVGLIGVLILAIVMIAVMFLGDRKDKGQTVNNTVNTNDDSNQEGIDQGSKIINKNGEEVEKDGNFLKLAINDIYGLKMKKGTNQAMFYQQQQILSVDPFSGKKYAIGSYPFKEISSFSWSQDDTKALVMDAKDYYIYEASSNLVHKFRYGIDNAIWNIKGDRIIYKYYDSSTGKREIKTADVNGENNQIVASGIPYRKVDLIVQPGINSICYFPHPDARVKGKLFCKNLNGEIKKEYGGRYGQDYLWSPDGSKLLTSFTKEESGNKVVLGVMNKSGGEARGLSIGTTVRKCVWSQNNVDVYCAVLGGAPLAIMLPNAWEEQVFNSVDTFWKINTETGEKKRLVNLDNMTFVIDSESLTLDAEESFLFFISRRDRSLWRLKL